MRYTSKKKARGLNKRGNYSRQPNYKWGSGTRYRSKTAFRRQRRRSGWMG